MQSRREYLNREIKSLCSRKQRIRLLCIGLTALRDLEEVLPLIERSSGEVIVLERNEQRPEGPIEECSISGLEIVPGDHWPVEWKEFGRFDFIYAPNLLHCVNDLLAKRSLARLASILKRGGRVLLSSFSPEMADSDYPVQGSFLRSEEQLSGLSDHIPDACFTGQISWRDDSGLLIFLEIHR